VNDKSSEPMVKMTNKRIKLGIDWVLKKGETVDEVANTFKVSTRRIEQLVKYFKENGKYPVLNPKRRNCSITSFF
jgi:transposase